MIIFETEFPKDFRWSDIKKILGLVTTGSFCQLICVPGAGKATILRLLAHNRDLIKFHLPQKEKSLRFVYVNFLELASFEEAQVARFLIIALDETPQSETDSLILTKQFTETINSLTNQNETIIFLFDHFDEYQKKLPRLFFQMLKSAKSVAKYKFSAIFATRRDLKEIIDEDIVRDYWDFFTDNTIYLKISDPKATDNLFVQIEKIFGKKLSKDDKQNILKLTGGHAKLTKIIAELVLGQNIKPEKESVSINPQVKSVLYELWLALTSVEQHQLFQLTKNAETATHIDEYLINSDLLRPKAKLNNSTIQPASPAKRGEQFNNLTFTIPIFEDFAASMVPSTSDKISFNPQTREILKGKNIISELLTAQEFRLLMFLVQNPARVIERDEIISAVWPETKNTEAISDEAIDQMVFRLRKKIEDEPSKPTHIQTIVGRGLKFEA